MAIRLITLLLSVIIVLSASAQKSGKESEGSAVVQVAKDELNPKYEVDSDGKQKLIKSENADVQVVVKFVNTLPSAVKLFWINYDGKKVLYNTLQPGSSVTQITYQTHPWIFEDALTGERYGIDNNIVFRAIATIDPITQELKKETFDITTINNFDLDVRFDTN